MGLDLYVGPITRYVTGSWQTVLQQTFAAGRGRADPAEASTAAAVPVVRAWRDALVARLGVDPWRESLDEEYWTDKPGWEGYGAVVLLAAYAERPALRPSKGGRLRRAAPLDVPRDWSDAAAYKDAFRAVSAGSPSTYTTLIAGVEWWLPIPSEVPVFRAAMPNGREIVMGSVERLRAELYQLNRVSLQLDPPGRTAARRAGPPEDVPEQQTVEATAPFALAVFLAAADRAVTTGMPLVLDY